MLSSPKRHKIKGCPGRERKKNVLENSLKNPEHLHWIHLYAITDNAFIKLVLVENLKKKLVFLAIVIAKQ